MSESISFDRAADFYDRTRDLPEPVASRGIQAILDIVGPGAIILDVGTGTGRVSVPLLKRGANLIGCDLSRKMMARLREKVPAARLAEADAARLPFSSRQFDAVITCHVMHLVGPWREAAREYRRVLKSGGVYINAYNDEIGSESLGARIHQFWESRVAAHGGSSRRPGIRDEEELRAELMNTGAMLERIEAARFRTTQTVREVVERITNRIDSGTWAVTEDIFGATINELREWTSLEFPDLDAPFEEDAAFILDVARYVG